MSGPAPKTQRRRRNADTYADVQTRVPAKASRLHGPTFRSAIGDALELYSDAVIDQVQIWWQSWREAPQAQAFLGTDWQRLTMLAPMVASYIAQPHHMKLAEIRQNESLLGATHVDRLRARIKVETAPETVTAPGVTAISDYRDRLSG